MMLKFVIIWMRIGQVIRLQNDINFSETVCIKKCDDLEVIRQSLNAFSFLVNGYSIPEKTFKH